MCTFCIKLLLYVRVVDRPILEMLECGENVPSERLSARDVQQDIALSYAAAPDSTPKRPVSAAECFEALQVMAFSGRANLLL